ncbi:MAG: hypothetical protein HZY74_10440 [Brevundimonas sp.]|nr:MAG: hypothetical protein HZY74_10440 [Brevundimonas sp.]
MRTSLSLEAMAVGGAAEDAALDHGPVGGQGVSDDAALIVSRALQACPFQA